MLVQRTEEEEQDTLGSGTSSDLVLLGSSDTPFMHGIIGASLRFHCIAVDLNSTHPIKMDVLRDDCPAAFPQ